jgi:outer membrane protein assembly factor BamB
MEREQKVDITKPGKNGDESYIWCIQIGGYSTYGDGKLWRICDDELWEIDVNTARVSYIDNLKIEGMSETCFAKSIYHAGIVYCLPSKAVPYIGMYDTKTGEKKYYKGKKEIFDKNVYNAEVITNEKIYAFSSYGESILVISMSNGALYDIDVSYKDAVTANGNTGLGTELIIVDEKVYIPSWTHNRVLVFDLRSEKWEWKLMAGVNEGFLSILRVENKVYLLDTNSILYETDLELKKTTAVYSFDEQYISIKAIHDNRLLLVPKYKNKIAKFNLHKMELEFIDYPDDYLWSSNYSQLKPFTVVGEFDNIIYLGSWYSDTLLLVDKNTGKMTSNKWNMNSKDYEYLVKKTINQNSTIQEENYLPLSVYLEVISQAEIIKDETINCCGKKILLQTI